MIYSVVLISAVQQSGSVMHTYIYSFLIFFSIMLYPRRWDIIPSAIQQDLVAHPF